MKEEVDLTDSYKILHPRPVVLICAKSKDGRANIMSCSWITPVSDEPPFIAVSLWKEGYTHKLIDETEEFTVNIPSSKMLEQVWLAGTKSGSKTDKIKLLKLNLVASKTVDAPGIEECLGTLECKVETRVEVGEQIIYIAEVKRAVVDGTYFKKGIWTEEAKLLLHCARKIFSTPKLIKSKKG